MGRIFLDEKVEALLNFGGGEAALKAAAEYGEALETVNSARQTLKDSQSEGRERRLLLTATEVEGALRILDDPHELIQDMKLLDRVKKVQGVGIDAEYDPEARRRGATYLLTVDNAARWSLWGNKALTRLEANVHRALDALSDIYRPSFNRLMHMYEQNQHPLCERFAINEDALLEAADRPPPTYAYVPVVAGRGPITRGPAAGITPTRISSYQSPYPLKIEVDKSLTAPVISGPPGVWLELTRAGYCVRLDESKTLEERATFETVVYVPPTVVEAQIFEPQDTLYVNGIADTRISSTSGANITVGNVEKYTRVAARGGSVVFTGWHFEIDFDGSNADIEFKTLSSKIKPEVRNPGGILTGVCNDLSRSVAFDVTQQDHPPRPEYEEFMEKTYEAQALS